MKGIESAAGGHPFLRKGGCGMRPLDEIIESLRQRRKARAAFREYARNGWQCRWMKKNSLRDALFRR